MRVVALVSGGKDSTYCMLQCVSYGHTIVALANLHPPNSSSSKPNRRQSADHCVDPESGDDPELENNGGGVDSEKPPGELDSYMYQTVGHEVLHHYAHCLGVPLYRAPILGSARHLSRDKYRRTSGDEVEDLAALLQRIADDGVMFDAVASGAILSDYQRTRVEHVCQRLGVTSLCYLWQRDQRELLHEMIECRVHAVLVKVACLGLTEKHLGASIADMQPVLVQLADKYGVNVCGEGGEYETLTLDCPLFLRRLVIDRSSVVVHSDDAFAPVLYLHVHSAHTELKSGVAAEQRARVSVLPIPPLLPLSSIVTESQQKEPLDRVHLSDVGSDGSRSALPEPRVIEAGNWLYLGPVAAGDGGGMEKAMRVLTQLLILHNTSVERLAFLDMYVADLSDYNHHNSAYSRALCDSTSSEVGCRTPLHPPVRCCVQVPLPAGCSVLLSAGVWRSGCTQTGPACSTLHVQSWSHWAPANIGPYSQAVRRGRRVHLAGMIGLEPARQLLVRSPQHQAALSLRHTQRVLHTFIPLHGQQQQQVQGLFQLMVTCFVTDASLVSHCRQLAVGAWSPHTLMFVIVVVAAALPRSAAVEWQLIAHLTSGSAVSPPGGATSRLNVAGVAVTIDVRQIRAHCAAYACVRCRWSDTNACTPEALHKERLSQLRACLRSTSQCLTSRCGGSDVIGGVDVGCRLTVYYLHDFFGADVAAVVAGDGFLKPNCVAVMVPTLLVEDGSDQCVIVGMADGSYSDKED